MHQIAAPYRPALVDLARWSAAGAAAVAAFALRDSPSVAAIPAVLALVAMPGFALPAFAVVSVRTFGESSLGGPLIGQLRLTDICLVLFIVRSLASKDAVPRLVSHGAAGALVLAWTFGVTMVTGVSITPLLRLAVYGLAGYCVATAPRARRFLENSIIVYACLELAISLPAAPERLYGMTIGDPAQFGGLMIVASALALLRVRRTPVRVFLVAYLLTGAWLSMTRSVWFAAITVLVVLLAPRGRWYLAIALPCAGAAASLPLATWVTNAAHLNPESINIRLESFHNGIQAIRGHPLAGQGWSYFQQQRHLSVGTLTMVDIPPFNLWLFVAASTGLVGLVVFAVWLVLLAAHRGGADRVSQAAITVMVAMGATEMPIYAGALLSVVFLLLIPPSSGAATPSAEPGTRRAVRWRPRTAGRPDIVAGS